MALLKFTGAVLLIALLFGAEMIVLGLSACNETHQQEDKQRTPTKEELEREAGQKEMVRLAGLVSKLKVEIATHDVVIKELDTSDYDATKAAVERSFKLSNDLYDLTQQYEGVANDMGCAYPGALSFTLQNGVRVTLPCHL